jgi:ABC-2 type transport system ATP-binding protein
MVNEDGTKVLPGIIDTLRNSAIEITTINLKKPSMDDVFVFYTGREIRDEGAAPAKPAFLRAGGR